MLQNTIVVSDIDDTIKWSHILGLGVLVDGLKPELAFRGMPELYTALADAGATVVYVTGGPDILVDKLQLNSIPARVMSMNRFPPGRIFLHPPGESTEDFKVATITNIMKENPAQDFILIGDNGEKDVETYTRVRQNPEIGSRVKQVFIHKIYNGGRSLEPKPDQHAFITAAELAAMLFGFDLLDGKGLTAVAEIVDQGMKDTGQNHDLTLPFAAKLVPAKVDEIYASLPKTIDSPTQDLLNDIHNLILEQANRGPRAF